METKSQTTTNAGNSFHNLLPHTDPQSKDVMEEDKHGFNLKISPESARLVEYVKEKHRRRDTEEQADTGSVNWTESKHFTVEVGKDQIREFIQSWELQPCWLYSLDFLHSTEEEHYAFYHYRARFSTPTPGTPIQRTASVYFLVGISKVKPGTLPVEVLFTVESNRLVHTPGRSRFREKWLTDVTESKTLLQSEVNL